MYTDFRDLDNPVKYFRALSMLYYVIAKEVVFGLTSLVIVFAMLLGHP